MERAEKLTEELFWKLNEKFNTVHIFQSKIGFDEEENDNIYNPFPI